jgi:ATP-binding cassette subfamily B (MDR/TAP) protein 1
VDQSLVMFTDSCTRQIRELQMGTSQPLGSCLQSVVATIAALGLAFYTSWNLTLVTLAAVPVAAVIVSVIGSKIQPNIEAQQAGLTIASKLANNAISSIDTVKAFNGQRFELRQYSSSLSSAAQWYLKQARLNAFEIGFLRLMILGMFVQGFWYGSNLVASGKSSAGNVLTTFWACLMAIESSQQILPQMLVLEKGRAAGAALAAILDHLDQGKPAVEMTGRKHPEFCEGDIEVRNVSLNNLFATHGY